MKKKRKQTEDLARREDACVARTLRRESKQICTFYRETKRGTKETY